MKIGIVCGSFHRAEVERMLEWSNDEASKFELTVSDVVWVPGAMEVPLALDRLLCRDDIGGAACLGIIEKGQTKHGLAMGQAVRTPTHGMADLLFTNAAAINLARVLVLLTPNIEPARLVCVAWTQPTIAEFTIFLRAFRWCGGRCGVVGCADIRWCGGRG